MDQIVEIADRLGKALAGSPQAAALRAARKDMDAQPELKQALTDYQDHSDKLARLQEENKPIEIEDKHKLQDLENKLFASDVFKRFTAAQVDYVDLMRQVNGALQKHLATTESG